MGNRLIIVANRTPERVTSDRVGGLEAALTPAVDAKGGVWVGWSGVLSDDPGPPACWHRGSIEVVATDLRPRDVAGYYNGFSNQVLWPALHGFPDRVVLRANDSKTYEEVNEAFADVVMGVARPGDRIWVHDYHLIPLGAGLRARGWMGRLGYFHHIPVPAPETWRTIPQADTLSQALTAYDLLGVQTPAFQKHLQQILPREALDRVGVYPISIDPAAWRALAAQGAESPVTQIASGRRLILGLDRLDYSKGIPLRIDAFSALLKRRPELVESVVMGLSCVPSRQAILAYRAERDVVERRSAELNARHGGARDVVYVLPGVGPPASVATAYRQAAVCLVTSIADGMNLVAKEFIAAQAPSDPGVLVLSRGCGAAVEMSEALLVDPGDEAGTADAIERALDMSAAERRERWRALAERLDSHTVHDWSQAFLRDLDVR